ncbi:hypothetical protein Pint_27181 [Pistacia integerrima]|uniref:Uncharacterized protein n=1 Tax=Pistacia integerrima TaxID=434235 RepID=A0ACC0YRW8_9ROSI|nr:hypothetical protein Pint_27181 [Pistacia integerrima]
MLFQIAGGTGITPMLSDYLYHIANSGINLDRYHCFMPMFQQMIYCSNRSLTYMKLAIQIEDILHSVDKPSKNWKGRAGYISKDMVIKGLLSPSDDTLILFNPKLDSLSD